MLKKKAIIFGETGFAIACMEHLLKNDWQICAVISRDLDVKNWCLKQHITCLSIDNAYSLTDRQCYLFSIINHYIISKRLLSHLNPIRALNYHDSLLPKYAGVNSTTWAILNNESFHGISWHEIVQGIDQGDIFYQRQIALDSNISVCELNLQCTEFGLEGFITLVNDIECGKLTGIQQDVTLKTYFGRDYILDNYGYIDSTTSVTYSNRLLNSVDFGSQYINPVATIKVKIDNDYYIVEKKAINTYLEELTSNVCTLKNIYGRPSFLEFDLTKIDSFILNADELNIFRGLKQKEFAIHSLLKILLNDKDLSIGLLPVQLNLDQKKELKLNIKYSLEKLSLLLLIILTRLGGNKSFIKIYYSVQGSNELIQRTTEQISLLGVDKNCLGLSYSEVLDNVKDTLSNSFHITKDFGYRYNLDLASEIAILADNQVIDIDNHRLVFVIDNNKLIIRYYEIDTNIVELFVECLDVLSKSLKEMKVNEVDLDTISLLSDEQYNQVIYKWNDTDKVYPDNKTIHKLFEEQVEKTPNNIALVYEDINLTYKELNKRANQLANYIRQHHDLEPDTLVALCLDRSEHMLIAILAALKAGGAYVPIDPSYPDERIKYILEDTNTQLVLTNEVHKQRLQDLISPTNIQVVATDSQSIQEQLLLQQSDNIRTDTKSTDLAYVIYTSGTTGKPKGVLQLHSNVMRLFTATDEWYKFNSSDVWTLFHSYVFDFTVWEIWGALIYGGKLVILSHEQTRDLNAFYELCLRNKVTILNQTPTAFYQFIDIATNKNPTDKLITLKYIIFGGEALNLAQLKPWFNCYGYDQPKLINMYGITETTVHVTYKPIEEQDLGENSYIGEIIPDLKSYILSPNLAPLPIGAIGELYIGGAGLARGYLNCSDLTAEKFIFNPFQTEEGKKIGKSSRLYKTGDLVRWLPNGNLEYIGRNDFQIKIRGYRIELGEIENVLSSYKGIKQSVVLIKNYIDSDKTATNNKYLVAYYVSVDKLNEDSLINYLQTKLPDYMVPNRLVRLEKLPLTINGKLDYQALPDPCFTKRNSYIAPRNEIETAICQIWAEVLGLPQDKVGIGDDFFKLGGDSILVIRLVNKLNKILRIQIKVRDVFELKCISNLLPKLEQNIIRKQIEVYIPFSLVNQEDDYQNLQDFDLIEDIYPASYLQNGMLLEAELNNDGTYHDVFSYSISAIFNKEKLLSIFQALVNKHELLRVKFIPSNNGWDTVVYKNSTITYKVYKDQDSQELINNERLNIFDYNKPGLFRLIINEIGNNFDLIFSFHHAITDGWSIASLINEFLQAYIHNRPILIHSELRYGEFVRDELSVIKNQEHSKFWQTYLEDLSVSNVNWKFCTAKSDNSLYNKLFSLEIEQVKLVHSIAKENEISIDSIFLLAYLKTLSYFVNCSDITIGLVVSNRLEKEGGDELFGLFLNTIPFRIQLQDNQNLSIELLEVFNTKLKLQKYQQLPYGYIKSLFKRELYDFAFNFIHFHIMNDSANIINSFSGYEKTNIPFVLNVSQSGEVGFDIRMSVHDNYISPDFLEYFSLYYKECLTSILSISNSNLNLIANDYQQIICKWNQTDKAYPDNKTIHQLFEEQVEKTPNNIALIYEETKLTYTELNERANQLANYIRQNNDIKPDTLVALCLDRSEHMSIAILAVLKAGGAYVPIDPSYPDERMKYILENTTTKLVLTNEVYEQKLQDLVNQANVQIVVIDSHVVQEQLLLQQSYNLKTNTRSTDLMYVIYTSGTTGNPKGVMLEHKGIVNRIKWMNDTYPLKESDRILQKTPYVFDVSVWELFWANLYGGTIVFSKPEGHKDADYLLNLIKKESITVTHFVPSMLGMFEDTLEGKKTSLLPMKYIFCSGEALTLHQVKKCHQLLPNTEIHNLYGPTEASVDVLYYDCNDKEIREVYIGSPISNTKAYILSLNLKPLPIGAIGELYVGGAGLARGYLNQPDLTTEKFIHNPFQTEEEKKISKNAKLYKTGDIARWLPDGNIEYIGRNDFQVKIRGYRVELSEIENVLSSYEGVKQSVVLVKNHISLEEIVTDNKYLVAYYVSNSRLDEDSLIDYLRSKLPDYMVPNVVVHLQSFPLTINGKLDRKALPDSEFTGNESRIAPRNGIEAEICQIWADVLGVPQDKVSIRDDFFRLGGNSILAIRLLNKLNKELNDNINFTVFFKNSTVEKLVKYLEYESTDLKNSTDLKKSYEEWII